MSVVNQMLLDLDRRRASPVERHALPCNVHSALPRRSYRPVVLAGVLAAAATAAIAGAALLRSPAFAPQPPVVVAPASGTAGPSVPLPAGPAGGEPDSKHAKPALAADPGPVAAPLPDTPRKSSRDLGRTSPPAGSHRIGAGASETPLKATMSLAGPVRESASETARFEGGDQGTLDKRSAVEPFADRLQQAIVTARRQLEQGHVAAALYTLQAFGPVDAASAEFRGLLAAALQRAGRHAEAVAEYRAALRMMPGMSIWWLGLALSLEAEGRLAESREALRHARAGGGLSAELAAYVDEKLRHPD